MQAAFGSLSLENGESGGASASAMRRPGRPNAVKKFVKLGLPRLIKDSKVRSAATCISSHDLCARLPAIRVAALLLIICALLTCCSRCGNGGL